MNGPKKNKYIYIIIPSVIATVLLFVYFTVDPASSIFFPKCIFHQLTGLECPGCGSQRAIHQLLHGNIIEAARYNLLLVIAIPYILLWCILSIIECGSKDSNQKTISLSRTLKKRLYTGAAVWIVLAVIILFWILRNIEW